MTAFSTKRAKLLRDAKRIKHVVTALLAFLSIGLVPRIAMAVLLNALCPLYLVPSWENIAFVIKTNTCSYKKTK